MFYQFLLYSKVTRHSHIILHHVPSQVIRYIVPCAIWQDLNFAFLKSQSNYLIKKHSTPKEFYLGSNLIFFFSLFWLWNQNPIKLRTKQKGWWYCAKENIITLENMEIIEHFFLTKHISSVKKGANTDLRLSVH